uniref:Uncharacterized protein n=1 Tax=Anguilla anguilla TaxID=7936 RepID=A0A0E9WHQ9_ANGAN
MQIEHSTLFKYKGGQVIINNTFSKVACKVYAVYIFIYCVPFSKPWTLSANSHSTPKPPSTIGAT